jgi:hypothetical protein
MFLPLAASSLTTLGVAADISPPLHESGIFRFFSVNFGFIFYCGIAVELLVLVRG